MKILKILLLIIALNCITGCWHFKTKNLIGQYLDDCSDNEKIKFSLTKILKDGNYFGKFNVDSLDYDIRDQDSIYVIHLDIKARSQKDKYLNGYEYMIVSKKECQIVADIIEKN